LPIVVCASFCRCQNESLFLSFPLTAAEKKGSLEGAKEKAGRGGRRTLFSERGDDDNPFFFFARKRALKERQAGRQGEEEEGRWAPKGAPLYGERGPFDLTP